MEKKDYMERNFSILCLGIAVLFAAVGVLACLSSIDLSWKVLTGFTAGGATLIYAFLAWQCRK